MTPKIILNFITFERKYLILPQNKIYNALKHYILLLRNILMLTFFHARLAKKNLLIKALKYLIYLIC